MKAKKLEYLNNDQIPSNTQKVLQWLLDPTEKYRGSGRTTQMLIALVEIAVRNPGTILKFRDHFPFSDAWKIHPIMNNLIYIAKQMYPEQFFSVYGDLFICRNPGDTHSNIPGEILR